MSRVAAFDILIEPRCISYPSITGRGMSMRRGRAVIKGPSDASRTIDPLRRLVDGAGEKIARI